MQHNSKKSKEYKLVIVVIFIGLFLWLYYFLSDPIPFISKKKFDYKSSNITQTFDVKLKGDGSYLIGLYTAKNYELLDQPKDGNYTIEYFHNGKLFKTTKYEQNLKDETDKQIDFENHSGNHIIRLEQFSFPLDIQHNRIRIKITTHKPLSVFSQDTESKHKNYFIVLKRGKGTYAYDKMFDDWMKSDARQPNFKDTWDMKEIIEPNATKLQFVNALMSKDFKTVKSMMENGSGIDVNTTFGLKGKFSIVHRKTNVPTDRTALFYSAFVNDTKTLQYLIDKGSDLYHLDIAKNYALNYAIENSSIDAIKLFVKAGMNIDKDVDFVYQYKTPPNNHTVGSTALSPLTYAVSIGDYNLTKTLLELNNTRMIPITFELKPSFDIKNMKDDIVPQYHLDAYYFIREDIPNYRELLFLLLQHDLVPIKNGYGPKEKDLIERFNYCKTTRGEWCKDVLAEDFNYEKHLMLYYGVGKEEYEKFLEKKQVEYTKINSQKGEKNGK